MSKTRSNPQNFHNYLCRQLEDGGMEIKMGKVLCGSSCYTQKYYFNQEFNMLPEQIKQELQILCVTYTEDVGGELVLEYNDEGELEFKTMSDEGDYLYDEIGSVLKIKQLRAQRQELLESLELFYTVVYQGKEGI